MAKDKKIIAPLIIEPHPKEYNGLPFITLIQYRKQPLLVIIDNITNTTISAYILDMCGPEGIDPEIILSIASTWYNNHRQQYPISIEFSKANLTDQTSKIYRSLNVEFVSRIIGSISKYPITNTKSIKRRRRKPIPLGVEVYESDKIIEQGLE